MTGSRLQVNSSDPPNTGSHQRNPLTWALRYLFVAVEGAKRRLLPVVLTACPH